MACNQWRWRRHEKHRRPDWYIDSVVTIARLSESIKKHYRCLSLFFITFFYLIVEIESYFFFFFFDSQSQSLIAIVLYQVHLYSILKMCGTIIILKCIAKCVSLIDSIISLAHTQWHRRLSIQITSFQVLTESPADNWPSKLYRVSRLKYHQCRNLNLVLTRL